MLVMYDLKEAVFDAYPSLRDWRRFRFGLLAVFLEALAFFGVLACTMIGGEMGYAPPSRLPLPPALILATQAGLSVLGVSVLLALIGLAFDRRKGPSVVVLASFVPAFMIAIGGPFV